MAKTKRVRIMEPSVDQATASDSEPEVKVQPKPEAKAAPKPDAKNDLKSLPLAEVEKKLGSSADGLTEAEAQERVGRYGPHEIEEPKTSEFLKFLGYFWG